MNRVFLQAFYLLVGGVVLALLAVSLPQITALAALGSLSAWGGYLLWRGRQAMWQVLRRPTTPLGRAHEGEIEVAGTIEVDEPIKAVGSVPCALIEVEVHSEWTTGSGKNETAHHEVRRRVYRGKGAVVRDATGSCRLADGDMRVESAPHRTALGNYDIEWLSSLDDAYGELMIPGANYTVVERRILVGSEVLVSGLARRDPQEAPQGYREATGPGMLVGPSPSRALLVAAGTQGEVLRRAAVPMALIGSLLAFVWATAGAALLLLRWIG